MKYTSSFPKKGALLLFSIAVLLAGPAVVSAQFALDGFDPNANAPVHVAVVQPDGKILLGGEFTTLFPNGGAPVTRNRIARLNPDGTLDATFNPNADGAVLAIVVQADGKVLAGGGFLNIGGQMRNHLARLDATSGLADTFNPNADLFVSAIAVQADGKILAGGIFTTIGGQTRNSIARLDATTGLADLTFNPNASPNGIFGAMNAIVVQADGIIVVGGTFTNIGGLARTNIARLEATTGLADSFAPNANSSVQAIAVQADGKILVGGGFTSIGGQSRRCIARLDATTGSADSFDPYAIQPVYSIAVQADGKILAGGYFTFIGGQTRNYIARLDPTTGLPDSFDPGANAVVLSIAVQADGKILAGGNFTTNAPNGGLAVARNRIARLETDGRLDRALVLGMLGSVVYATAVQPDGKILIGGLFTNILGVARTNLARLNTDSSLDMAFNPNPNGEVRAIAVQADGKILAGGAFSGANSFGGQPRNYLARLEATTGLADAFDPHANDWVNSIAVQADGKIVAGGSFNGANSIGGATRNRIARLDATTGLADAFDPNANGDVLAIAVQTDGKILAGGNFSRTSSIGGQTRNRIARLEGTNGLADSFNPNASGMVLSIAAQANGKILVGGEFNGVAGIGGATRNRIARLDAATGFADPFDPNANNAVRSIAVQADGRILAGGNFSGANSIGGQTRSLFARLSNDTAALQNLAVTQTTLTWTRGGSSPQFTRVTFESSTNNANYLQLGNGTPSASNWTLTGLNLSTGQNLHLRARGYYRSGYQNGSESIAESVRNVFLPLPPQLKIQFNASTNVVLSWATNFTGFTLEANTNLNANVWSTVSPAHVVSGTNNVVTNAVSGSTRFYRLRK